ncbi:MAG: Maf family protein [Candidatus Omnitrophica bacterium]|nr:Maf family protein [Candidatus Omnitrophota bacterium]
MVGRQILGKPRSLAEAERMLRRLSGTTHRVITAVALVRVNPARPGAGARGARPPWHRVRHAVSRVTMRRLTPAEIRRDARRHRDKAGGYAIQAKDSVVTRVDGSRTNVVGFPKEVVLPLLRRLARIDHLVFEGPAGGALHKGVRIF